jgi:hypothetical protein
VAGNEPLLVGWLKLKTNGGGLEVVVVEVVTVDPLGLVLHTPLLGVTVWATAGPAKGKSSRARGDSKYLVIQFKLTNQIDLNILKRPIHDVFTSGSGYQDQSQASRMFWKDEHFQAHTIAAS